jgi:hypothetical protein
VVVNIRDGVTNRVADMEIKETHLGKTENQKSEGKLTYVKFFRGMIKYSPTKNFQS